MTQVLVVAAGCGLLIGVLLGYRTAVAVRTYRDARVTTRSARKLWRQLPQDWGRVVRVAALLAVLVAAAVAGFRAGR